ncbi:MAG TPA: RdgB/HAM1 family non-canonical purine NTP pyrophosphatase [Alphaproteobacteria bacterium]
MTRKFTGGNLVLATHNKGKVIEIGALLAPFDVEVISAGDLNLPEPEETGATFIDNAKLKALAAAAASGLPALADDSGLSVNALGGAPGIFSARWAGPEKDFAMAMERVQRELAGKPDRRAAFICALALAWPDGHTEIFEGRIDGTITDAPRGSGGFGYDPIFIPLNRKETFGEMDPAQKQAMSHRAQAFAKLVDGCFKDFDKRGAKVVV